MSDGVMAVYSDLPADVQKHLLELETFIGDCDGKWTALQTSDENVVLDDGTIDASDAVVAFNGIVAALRATPLAAPAGGESEVAKAKPRPADCKNAMSCGWHHVATEPEIGLYLCNMPGCSHMIVANAAPAQSNGDERTTILDSDLDALLADRRELATFRDQLAKARAALEYVVQSARPVSKGCDCSLCQSILQARATLKDAQS